jgi:hypothetical protein
LYSDYCMDDKPAAPNDSDTAKNTEQNTNQNTGPSQTGSDWLSADNKVPEQKNISDSDMGAQAPASPFVSPGSDQKVEEKQEEVAAAPPQDALTSAPIVGPHSNSGGGGFKVFLIIGIILIIAIWAGVAYIYIQNKNLKDGQSGEQTQAPVFQVTPTPSFTPDQIKIRGGNVIREELSGEIVVLVNKDEYPSTGITGFLKVAVSPDEQMMCFESWSPAPEPGLYISAIDGGSVVEVSPNRQTCLWAPDSKSIYYINTASTTAPVNIFSYDIEQELETDLTSSFVPAGVVRRYEIIGLSADGSEIICRYENIGGAATSETSSECRIDLESGEVRDL